MSTIISVPTPTPVSDATTGMPAVRPTRIRTLLIDDERLARTRLRTLLEPYDAIEIVGEADTLDSALQEIERLGPDLVFLDIQMPGGSGFDLLERTDRAFRVVFITSFDEYALRAFEINAVDYLLKPVSADRLSRTMARLLAAPDTAQGTKPQLGYQDHLFITADGRARFLKISAIVAITAAGAYSEVMTTEGQRVLLPKPLREWETRLPNTHFARIHRGAIVNLTYVDRMEKAFNYTYEVFLKGIAQPLTLSRRHAVRLRKQRA